MSMVSTAVPGAGALSFRLRMRPSRSVRARPLVAPVLSRTSLLPTPDHRALPPPRAMRRKMATSRKNARRGCAACRRLPCRHPRPPSPGLRTDPGHAPDPQMAGQAGLWADHHVVFQGWWSGDTACETITQPRPRRTLCRSAPGVEPRAGADHRVCSEPRSIVALAPTSTSSSRMTRQSCGTLWNPSR